MDQASSWGVASLAFVDYNLWETWNIGPTLFWSVIIVATVALVLIFGLLYFATREGKNSPMAKLRQRERVIIHTTTLLPVPLDGSQNKISVLKNKAALVISPETLELHDLRKKDAKEPIIVQRADVVGIRLEPVSFLQRPESALFVDTRFGTIAFVLMLPKVEMRGRPVAPGAADVAQLLCRWHAGMTGSIDFSKG